VKKLEEPLSMRVSEHPSRARAETGETSKKPKPKTKPHKKRLANSFDFDMSKN